MAQSELSGQVPSQVDKPENDNVLGGEGTITHLAGSPDAVGPDAAGYLARVVTITGSRLVATGVRYGASAALGLKLKSPDPRGPLGARLK